MAKTRREKRREKVSAKRRVTEHQSGYSSTSLLLPDGVSLYKPKAGNRRIEILPYVVGDGNPFADPGTQYYERTYYVHRGIGPDNSSFVCPRKTAGKECFICDHRAKLAKDPKADEEEIKALAPKERQLWNVYDYAETDKGVQLWDVSHHLFGKRLDTEIRNADEDDGFEFFADPDDGFTLRVAFEDKSFAGNNFVEAASINFKARKGSLDEELLEAAQCLDDLLTLKSYEDLKKVFLQTAEEEDDEDEDDKPKRKPAKGKVKPEPEEDEEEDEDEEDEDPSFDVGDFVGYGKHGECEIVKVSKDGSKLDLEDEDGIVYKGVPVSKVTLADDEEDEEEEDDEPPKKKGKPAPAKKGKAKPEPEDDEEEEDDEDEEDEEEDEDDEDDEPPKRRGGKGPAKRSPPRK